MAIADGSLSGLKKAVVEKRLEEVKADDTSDILVSRPKPLVLDLGGGVKMEMVGCPKGKGILWPNTNCTFEITRPFWFGKYPVTVAEWERLMPPATPPPGVDRKNLDPKIPIQHFKTKQEGNIGLTRKEAEEFMAKLTQKFRSQIPAGYVFRLPTEKEWKYAAIRADSPDLQLLFNGKKADRGPGLRSKYVVQYGDCASYWKSREGASACCVEGAISPYIPVGSKTPNAWGIYDLFGPAIEPYLRDENLAQMVGIWGFCEGWFRGPFASNLHDEFDGGRPLKLRLVVGPDLMRERGIKPPNTGK